MLDWLAVCVIAGCIWSLCVGTSSRPNIVTDQGQGGASGSSRIIVHSIIIIMIGDSEKEIRLVCNKVMRTMMQ